MFKRTAIISVVFIFMFAASFCVADEHRQGAKARRIEERLGQLHEMIEQGEVKLDRMRAEAGELEAMLRRESGDPDEGRRGEERHICVRRRLRRRSTGILKRPIACGQNRRKSSMPWRARCRTGAFVVMPKKSSGRFMP